MKVTKNELQIFRGLRRAGLSVNSAEEVIRDAREVSCMDALYFVRIPEDEKNLFHDILRNYQLPLRRFISETFCLWKKKLNFKT